jgi:hypothetical protein
MSDMQIPADSYRLAYSQIEASLPEQPIRPQGMLARRQEPRAIVQVKSGQSPTGESLAENPWADRPARD